MLSETPIALLNLRRLPSPPSTLPITTSAAPAAIAKVSLSSEDRSNLSLYPAYVSKPLLAPIKVIPIAGLTTVAAIRPTD